MRACEAIAGEDAARGAKLRQVERSAGLAYGNGLNRRRASLGLLELSKMGPVAPPGSQLAQSRLRRSPSSSRCDERRTGEMNESLTTLITGFRSAR